MLNETGRGDLKTQSLKKQTWSVKDHEKLFEFILLNPNLVGQSPSSTQTITALFNFILPHKTLKDCEIKMTNLKGKMKSYGKMADYLKKKTKLSEEWILEKRKESGYFHISHFHKELMELRESKTIEHRALRMFLSNFYHKEAEFCTVKHPNIFATPQSDDFKNLPINQPRFNGSPSTVIKLKMIDSAEKKIDSSDKLSQKIFSTEKITKQDSIGDQLNSQIIGQEKEKEKETLHLKKFKWNCLQKLSYLVFILKYQMQFEHISHHNLTETMAVRLMNFMRPVTFRDCKAYHTYLMEKHKTVENIISSILNEDYFIKENVGMREIERIKHFFEIDVQRQLNAFVRKSKLTLESSDEEVFEIARTIKQQLAGRINFMSFDQQSKNSVILKQQSSQKQLPKLQFENQTRPIQLPVELTILFEAENKETNPSQFAENVSNDEGQFLEEANKTQHKPKRPYRRHYERQDLRILPKKERLKEKKILKLQKSEIQRLKNMKEEFFFQNEDFDQFNIFAGNRSEFKSDQSSSQNGQSINQEDCENQGSINAIKKPLIKKNKFKSEKMLKSIDSKAKMELEQEQSKVQQKEIHHRKQQRGRLWTLSQRMKVIAFLTVNKLTFLEGNNFEKQGIQEKLSKYIGTQRSNSQCIAHINNIKEIYQYDMEKVLIQEGKKHSIEQGLLQKWKKILDSYSNKCYFTIENYCLEVKVLPLNYAMGSVNSMLPQLQKLIKKGPFLEISMRQGEKGILENNNICPGEIEEEQTKFTNIKFRMKVKKCNIKLDQIRIKFMWNLKVCRL